MPFKKLHHSQAVPSKMDQTSDFECEFGQNVNDVLQPNLPSLLENKVFHR